MSNETDSGWNWIYGSGSENSGFLAIQLDIVGFLAVLGEGAVLANAEVASLSRISFLPRIMPAPQSLIRPFRPKGLHEFKGWTTSIESGNNRHYINHIGHVLVSADKYDSFTVRCVEVKRKQGKKHFHRDETKENHEDMISAKTNGPLTYVALTGFALSLIIFALAIWKDDGAGLVAIVVLSLLSSLVGYATYWKLQLQRRTIKSPNTPPGDVVIRYQKGNFLIVTCEEDVARQLYFAPEILKYQVENGYQYRIMSLVGTIMLMFGVIFLANAKSELQIAFAVAYIIMNALYWIVAALPISVHWDTSYFEVIEQCIQLPPSFQKKDPKGENEKSDKENEKEENRIPQPQKNGTDFVDLNKSFTAALWKAIVATKSIDWVRRSEAAPQTPAWDKWLAHALEKAQTAGLKYVTNPVTKKPMIMYELPDWNPGAALGICLSEHAMELPVPRLIFPSHPELKEGQTVPEAEDKV